MTTLRDSIPTVELEPAQIANGAVELLNEVSASKITGEEDRYSHTDLADFDANVAGAKAAFDSVVPLLAEDQAELVTTINDRFAALDAALAPVPGARWAGQRLRALHRPDHRADRRALGRGRRPRRAAVPCGGAGPAVTEPSGPGPEAEATGRGISRRRLLAVAGAAAGGLAVGSLAGGAIGAAAASDDTGTDSGSVPFHGSHQAGIATAAQDRLLFASFDVVTTRRAELEQLLRDWTAAAERLTQGHPVEGLAAKRRPATDTGEAVGLDAGATHADLRVRSRRCSAATASTATVWRRPPAALVDIPAFPGDALDPARGGGDLCVQACGDDPQVLFHAIRNLTRMGRGVGGCGGRSRASVVPRRPRSAKSPRAT